VAAGEPLMLVRRFSHDPTGRLVETVDAHDVGTRYDYRIDLVRAPAPSLVDQGSALGYEARMVGVNPSFSAANGIDVPRVVVAAMVVSGALGGIGGAAHALGVVHRFVAAPGGRA
jgi:hypothetical protein